MPSAVFISPHLDDAVYSCGGLIARQIGQGVSVTVMTVFAGDPSAGRRSLIASELESRWATGPEPIAARREEDLAACARLGAAAVHIGLPEALYRLGEDGAAHYRSEEALFGEPSPGDADLVHSIGKVLEETVLAGARVYAPLSIGGHVDHRLVRTAVGSLSGPVWYFHDLPYAARITAFPASLTPPDAVASLVPLSDEELSEWADACWDYTSQRSTFWDQPAAVRQELRAFVQRHGGLPIWAPGSSNR